MLFQSPVQLCTAVYLGQWKPNQCEEFAQYHQVWVGMLLKRLHAWNKVQRGCQCSPVLCKLRVDDLVQSYDVGVGKGVWKPTLTQELKRGHGNLPNSILVWNTCSPNPEESSRKESKPQIHVCGDYFVTVNLQLEPHLYPMPLPEDLMRKLSCGCSFTKIDLTDANNAGPREPEETLIRASSKWDFHLGSVPCQHINGPAHQWPIKGLQVYIDDIL